MKLRLIKQNLLKHKKDILYVLLIFIITRLLVILIGATAYGVFPLCSSHCENYPKNVIQSLDVEKSWNNFDSHWYIKTAKDGYPRIPFTAEKEATWGFMPLYPLILKSLARFTGYNYLLTGIIISNLASLATVFVLYKFFKEYTKEWKRAIWAIMLSAGTFFLGIVYTEGLFLLLTALVFYCTYKKKYFWALIFCGLASITRIHGILLFIIPCIEILQKYKYQSYKYLPAFLISLLPLAAFMFYLYVTCGDPLAFIKIQSAWGSSSLFPLQGFLTIFNDKAKISTYVNILFWILFLYFILVNYKKVPVSYTIFSLMFFLLSTSNETIYGSTRYILPVIPLYLSVINRPKIEYDIFMVINIIFLGVMITAFVTDVPFFI